MNRRIGLGSRWLLWTLCLPCLSLTAQVSPDSTGLGRKDSRDRLELNQVLISATRFERKIKEVSQRVEVLDRSDIEHTNAPQTGEFLQNTGSVLVQKSQAGGGSPIIRGFEANKILLVVDGVRMNNAIFRGGHLQNVLSVDQQSLERAEVLFGPSSVLYGSDALGGVIHFFTKKPHLARSATEVAAQGNVFARYSSAFREKTSHADVNFGKGKWAALSSFTISDFGDLQQGSRRSADYPDFGKRLFRVQRWEGRDTVLNNADVNRQIGSGYRQFDFMQKLLLKQSDATEHTLNFQYSTTNQVNRYDRLSELKGGKPRFAEWYYGPQERLLLSHKLESQLKSSMAERMILTTYFQQFKESRHDRTLYSNWLNNRYEKVRVWGLNAVFLKSTPYLDLSYGAEWNHNQVISKAHATNLQSAQEQFIHTRYPVDGSSMNSAALFVLARKEFRKHWLVEAGFRANYIGLKADFSTKTFFDFPYHDLKQDYWAPTGNLGLVWLPKSSWKLSASVSSGFRAPNIDDVSKVFDSVKANAQGGVQGVLILPNPDLQAEYSYHAELGIEKWIAGRIQISQSVFISRINGAIGVQNAQFNQSDYLEYGDSLVRVQKMANLYQARIYGLNFRLKMLLNAQWSFESTYNYTKGIYLGTRGQENLDHIPPSFGQTSLWYESGGIRAEFMLRFNGWKRLSAYNLGGEDNLQYATPQGMPSWYTLNFRISKHLGKHWIGQLGIENILDRNYRVFASGISAAGRNVVISGRYLF